jgi:hypothetical protein
MLAALLVQGPETIHVGRVVAVHWPQHSSPAAALAEMADAEYQWPGLRSHSDYPIRLVLAPNERAFDSITGGRLPGWGAGAAFPSTNTIVVVFGANMHQVLMHELAHLALRRNVRIVPRWFDEGYASRAAGEWRRLDVLRINWALVRGYAPALAEVSRDLRQGGARADAAYAYATTAVLLLERLGKERGLEPLVTQLAHDPDFDSALRGTYQLSLGQFEEMWRKDLRTRYGWLSLATSFSIFWTLVGGGVVIVWWRRRKRDRVRREALNVGWVVPDESDGAS